MPPDRTAFQVASLVREHLMRYQAVQDRQLADATPTLAGTLDSVVRLHRKLAKAQVRNWHGATKRIRTMLAQQLRMCTSEIHLLQDQFARHQSPSVPSLHQLLDELDQVEQEMGPCRYDRRRRTLCVTTDAIELEDIYLGEFRIELDLDRLDQLDQRHPYTVIAEDPHSAGGSEHVTHPHVSDERLCEGEATNAIRSALTTGRLADFFMLVNAVLNTYNPSSPYVALDEWDGTSCWECGDRGDLNTCDVCDRDFCDGDSFYCEGTHTSLCYGCGEECEHEGVWYHPNVMTRCNECDIRIMKDHLDEDGLCPTCHEHQEEHDYEEGQEGEDQAEAHANEAA